MALFSFATLFLMPMTIIILAYSCFMLRPPLIQIESHFLRWVVEYTDLYAKYEHAVMSWRLPFIIGFIFSCFAIAIEAIVRRMQGQNSLLFHVCLSFFVALASFGIYEQINFARISVPVVEYADKYVLAAYGTITSSLKTAVLYSLICYFSSLLISRIVTRTKLSK